MEDIEGVKKSQEDAVPDNQPMVEEDIQERNWKETNKLLKEQKAAIDRLAREKDEMVAMLQQMNNRPAQQEEEDDEIDVYSPDFGRKLERRLERAVEKTYAKIEEKKKNDPAYLEEQARKRYSDFDSVMTADNIDEIIKSNPLVHKSVMSSGAPLEAAYEFIKSSAAYQNKANQNSVTNRLVSEERKRLADNKAVPKSSNALPRSQAISNATGFSRMSKEQMEEVHRDTLRIKRGR